MAHYKHPRTHNYALVHINMHRGEPATSFDKLILTIFKEHYKLQGRKTVLRYRGQHKGRYKAFTLKKHAHGGALYLGEQIVYTI